MRSPEDLPADIIAAAEKLVDATFRAEVDRWDGNPDLPAMMVHYIAIALMERDRAATETERERCLAILREKNPFVGNSAWDRLTASIRSQP